MTNVIEIASYFALILSHDMFFHHMFLSGRAETLTLLPVKEAYNVNDLGGYILGK